jgi:hypothetical protein
VNGDDSGSISAKQAVSNKVINPGLLFNPFFIFKRICFLIFKLKYLVLNLLKSGGCCRCCPWYVQACNKACCPCLGDLTKPKLIGK